MAKQPERSGRRAAESETADDTLDFVGMGEPLAIHADAFFAVQNGDNFSLYFFQHQLQDLTAHQGKTMAFKTKRTKCIARIAVSPLGFRAMADALANQLGLNLVPKAKEERK
jgi:hypothetical protein